MRYVGNILKKRPNKLLIYESTDKKQLKDILSGRFERPLVKIKKRPAMKAGRRVERVVKVVKIVRYPSIPQMLGNVLKSIFS